MKLHSKISIERQETLIKQCIEEQVDMQSVLDGYNLTYEDLRYKHYADLNREQSPIEYLDDYDILPYQIPAISFFSGAGGLDVGMHYAGFQTLAAFEINKVLSDTLSHNLPQTLVSNCDVRNKDEVIEILNKIGVSEAFHGVFYGGPPCQPFSIAANQRFSKSGENFKRIGFGNSEYGNLLSDYVWYIKHFKPKVFVIENVSGLLEMDGGKQLSDQLEDLSKNGYTIHKPKVLNMANYGVPQNRIRLFVVGSRSEDVFSFPIPNSYTTSCFHIFDKRADGIANHETRLHKAESVFRYMQLRYGQRDHLGRVDRLHPEMPSKTVVAGGLKGGGRSHLHPFVPRTLSVRESARLQTFPDNYVFTGSSARQFTQVGNAVPPLFAYKLGLAIQEQYFSRLSEEYKYYNFRNATFATSYKSVSVDLLNLFDSQGIV
jgi:DNA (cytosine-5)-methyltransferase 1